MWISRRITCSINWRVALGPSSAPPGREGRVGTVPRVPFAFGDLLDRLACANDRAVPELAAELRAESPVLSRQEPLLQRFFDDELDLVQLEGFRDVIVGAFLHRRDGSFGTPESGDDNDHGLGRTIANLVQELDPGTPRHLDVRDD